MFSHRFAFSGCALVSLLVLQYTGSTSCLTRYRWLAASYAKSERYSFLALLLRTEPLVLFAFRLLVSGSVVLSAVSARCPFGARFFVSGFVVCRGLWAMARFWSGFFGGMAGCLDFSLRSRWSLRGCVVTAAGRLSAACRGFGVASYPWEWKGINKKSPFRWVYPRVSPVAMHTPISPVADAATGQKCPSRRRHTQHLYQSVGVNAPPPVTRASQPRVASPGASYRWIWANGSTISARTYRGWIRWLGEGREVDVVEMVGNPVIGTALLTDHRLTVDFVAGGAVEIEAIPSI